MELQNITSVRMTMAVLLGLLAGTEVTAPFAGTEVTAPFAGTEVTAKSRWSDLISGITLKSRDVIVGTVQRVQEIFPVDKMAYPDDLVISELVQYFKGKMKYSHPSLELPVLDPFFQRQLDFNITHDMIGQLSLYLEELNITKMSEFNINKIKMNWLRRKLEFDIRFPAIHIRSKYNMRGILGNVIPIHGNGPASISAINVNCTGTIDLDMHNNSLHINTLLLNYFIEQFQINMTNLMGDKRISELLNTVLSEEGTQILELVRTDVTQFGTNWLHSVGNYVLEKMSISFSGVLDFVQTAGTKKLPIKIDIIKHSREIDGKSTAVHAAVLAPDDVNIYTYPCIPNYGSDERVVLVFPGKDAVCVENLFDSVWELGSGSGEPRAKRINVGTKFPVSKAVFIDSTWNQSRGIYKDQRVRDLPCVVLQSRISQFWRHQNGSPRWYLATIEAIHQFLVELHTVAWSRNSGHLRAETLGVEARRNGHNVTQKVSPCVQASRNEVPDSDVKQDTSPADKTSCGTTYESGTGAQGSNPGGIDNEHSKGTDDCESFGPYKGEYDNLLFFFCYMYSKIHTLYNHEDLHAYKRPLK